MLAELAVDIDYRHLLSGTTLAEDCAKFDDWRNQICGIETSAPLYIDDMPAPDIGYIRTCIKQLPIERGVIVLDSINEMTPLYWQGGAENTHHDLMNDLRSLAKETDVVMIVMSSLDRGLEDRFDKRPRSDDLPSLALLAFCDLLLLFYRDEIYHPTSRNHGITEITVAKNRIGSGVGVCQMQISCQ
jgi:replicative DNA helicase